jgi:hypothetical protein
MSFSFDSSVPTSGLTSGQIIAQAYASDEVFFRNFIRLHLCEGYCFTLNNLALSDIKLRNFDTNPKERRDILNIFMIKIQTRWLSLGGGVEKLSQLESYLS